MQTIFQKIKCLIAGGKGILKSSAEIDTKTIKVPVVVELDAVQTVLIDRLTEMGPYGRDRQTVIKRLLDYELTRLAQELNSPASYGIK